MKLIRDAIPADMRANGYAPELKFVEGEDLVDMLLAKLNEESGEVIDADGKDIGEYGDVLEVLYALGRLRGFSPFEIEQARISKSNRRGGFGGGTVWMNDADTSPASVKARSAYASTESGATPDLKEGETQ